MASTLEAKPQPNLAYRAADLPALYASHENHERIWGVAADDSEIWIFLNYKGGAGNVAHMFQS